MHFLGVFFVKYRWLSSNEKKKLRWNLQFIDPAVEREFIAQFSKVNVGKVRNIYRLAIAALTCGFIQTTVMSTGNVAEDSNRFNFLIIMILSSSIFLALSKTRAYVPP